MTKSEGSILGDGLSSIVTSLPLGCLWIVQIPGQDNQPSSVLIIGVMPE